MRLKRIKCGETSCLYHDGGCNAGHIRVSLEALPRCVTYREFKENGSRARSVDPKTLHRYLGMEAAVMDAEAQQRRRSVECDALNCHYNHDYACWSPFIEIGYPRAGTNVDTTCYTHIFLK